MRAWIKKKIRTLIRTFEAENRSLYKNIQPGQKKGGSYKKKGCMFFFITQRHTAIMHACRHPCIL